MEKSLEGMSNEELWKLFPIIISEHNPDWKKSYEAEKLVLEYAVGRSPIFRMSHYGSTSVPGLLAKPTVDILLEIRDDTDTDALILGMKAAGYIYSRQPDNPPPHMMFMKGYTHEGFRGQAFHVHIRYAGDWDELYFRDYLTGHPDTVKEYGALKMQLKEKYEFDRDSYTAAKSDFIKNVTALARTELKGKYLPIDIQACTSADIELLAELNGQMIEDEKYDVRLSIKKLKERMAGFLENGYKAYLFKEHDSVRGYALVDFKREPLYLRHYFICRDYRRQGYGTTCLKKLLEVLGTDRIDIEVMFWNDRGYGFWKSFGFKERSIYMRLG